MADDNEVIYVRNEAIFLRGEGGSVFKLDLPLHEAIAERLEKGYLTRVANADGDPYVEGADTAKVPGPPTERPKLNAGKKAWVGWAVAQGMTPDDAEALTKTDLIEKFGTDPVSTAPKGEAPEGADTAKVPGEQPPTDQQ
ncbi:hypothetical protein [Microbacterium sp. 22242]|uniref:hypothetical protein n=1 Tax=Microbacterium sp. 22242 TaxID=3453896 RepID=UPI003F82C372